MKKILALVGLLSSMYAIPPCEYESDKVCVYLYKGAMSAEAILVNTTRKKVQVNIVEATLDGTRRELTNIMLNANQQMTLLKSRYNNPNTTPDLGHWRVSYKEIN